MLRDYQIEICERVREAFARHRSVMVQMPTGTGKTVVLAELVREYLNVNLNVNGGRNVLIVAHRRELVEQIQQALLRVMGAEDESSTSFGKYPSFRSLASKKGLVTEKVFLPHPSSPARRGSTSPSAPPPQQGAPTGKPAVLSSQSSSRPCGVARELPTQQSCDCLCAEGALPHTIHPQTLRYASLPSAGAPQAHKQSQLGCVGNGAGAYECLRTL